MAQELRYDQWFAEVKESLSSVSMNLDDWQRRWRFDFMAQYTRGVQAGHAAIAANRFWWYEQNKAMGKNCTRTDSCWLPSGHQGQLPARLIWAPSWDMRLSAPGYTRPRWKWAGRDPRCPTYLNRPSYLNAAFADSYFSSR
jgi:hypothetical protein